MTGKMTLLAFFSRCLGALKHVPGLPQVLDAGLLVLSALTSPRMFRQRLRLVEEVRRWPGVFDTLHVYGGIQFNVAEGEIGHLHGNGVLDLRFSLRLREELVQAGRATAHHTLPHSGWVSLSVCREEDVRQASELLRLAYQWRTGASLPSKTENRSKLTASSALSVASGSADIQGVPEPPVQAARSDCGVRTLAVPPHIQATGFPSSCLANAVAVRGTGGESGTGRAGAVRRPVGE